jgi:hypothetical protein
LFKKGVNQHPIEDRVIELGAGLKGKRAAAEAADHRG